MNLGNVLSLIIFFILSLVFNNIKNKNQKNDVKKEAPVKKNLEQTELEEFLGEVKKDFKNWSANLSEEFEDILKPSQPSADSSQRPMKEVQKKTKKRLSKEKQVLVLKSQQEIPSLIPEDYQSEEGISANMDYRREILQQEGSVQPFTEAVRKPLEVYFANSADLKKALIIKEILDKPLSLRK